MDFICILPRQICQCPIPQVSVNMLAYIWSSDIPLQFMPFLYCIVVIFLFEEDGLGNLLLRKLLLRQGLPVATVGLELIM